MCKEHRGICYVAYTDYPCKNRCWWGWCERQHFKLDQWLKRPCACKAFCFPPKFVLGFQYDPICRDFRSESRYGNEHNTSLHLWPPSSSSSLWTRGNNGGEWGKGRKIAALFRCLLKVHKLKDSTFNSGNKSVFENLLARCFTRGCCGWKRFSLLHWGKKKIIIIKKEVEVTLRYVISLFHPKRRQIKKYFV